MATRTLPERCIPDSNLRATMSLLSTAEVGRCARVSTHWHHLALSDVVWKSLFLNNWPLRTAHMARVANAPHYSRVVLGNQQYPTGTPPIFMPSTNKDCVTHGVDWLSRYRQQARTASNRKHGLFRETLVKRDAMPRITRLRFFGDSLIM